MPFFGRRVQRFKNKKSHKIDKIYNKSPTYLIDGKYNKNNVPYSSNSFLKISSKGVDDGDFVMVVGYPGRTNRLLTFNEIEYDLEIQFQEVVKFLKRGIELINEHAIDEDGSKLKYRGLKSGYENYYKKISGQINGAKNFKLLESEKVN